MSVKVAVTAQDFILYTVHLINVFFTAQQL